MGMSSSPTTTSTLNPGQQALAKLLGTQIPQGVGNGIQSYQGQIVPGLDQGYGQVRSLLGQYNPGQYSQQTSGALGSALSGQPSYNLDPATTANYFQNSIAGPNQRNYQQNIQPQIDQQFAGTGGLFGTARGFAQANALSNLQANNTNQLAQIQQQNQGLQANLAESAANRQVQGVGLAQQQAMLPIQGALGVEQALQPFQQNQQQQAAAQYQEWLRTQAQNNPYLQLALQYLNTTTQAAYQQPNATPGLIGTGAGALLGLFGGPLGSAVGAGIGGGIGGMFNGGTNSPFGGNYLQNKLGG